MSDTGTSRTEASRPRTFALALWLVVAGCSAHLTAYRDPAYTDRSFTRIAVFTVGMRLDAALRVEQDLCARIATVGCVAGKSVLLPTRGYSPHEAHDASARGGIDGVLAVALRSDQSDLDDFGTTTTVTGQSTSTTTGAVSLYGNQGFLNATTTSMGTVQVQSSPNEATVRTVFTQRGLMIGRPGSSRGWVR